MPSIKGDNKIFLEDALLTKKIIYTISLLHSLTVYNIYRHIRIGGYEVDALAICKTPDKYERWVGFELKDSAIDKAITQAVLRRKYFDYFYVVIDRSTHTLVKYIISDTYRDMVVKNGIGIISASDDVVILSSKYRKREFAEYDYKRKIAKTQIKLFQFLEENDKWPAGIFKVS